MDRKTGFYGKLPGYGDFVERALPTCFTEPWDAWLQQAMACSRQMLQEHWLNAYLTSPVWRFALSPGCLDQRGWLGVLLPSVDRVGRYFPLTLACPLQSSPDSTNTIHLIQTLLQQQDWLHHLQEIGLACLQDAPSAEALLDVLDELALPLAIPWPEQSREHGLCLSLSHQASTPISLQDSLNWNEALLRHTAGTGSGTGAYSLWTADVGEDQGEVLLSCPGLPAPASTGALLTGQWQNYGWYQVPVSSNPSGILS